MPHTKSAAKRVRQGTSRNLRYRAMRGAAKTIAKKLETAVAAKDLDLARRTLAEAQKRLDKAAGVGAIHANNASRHKALLARKVAALVVAKTVPAG